MTSTQSHLHASATNVWQLICDDTPATGTDLSTQTTTAPNAALPQPPAWLSTFGKDVQHTFQSSTENSILLTLMQMWAGSAPVLLFHGPWQIKGGEGALPLAWPCPPLFQCSGSPSKSSVNVVCRRVAALPWGPGGAERGEGGLWLEDEDPRAPPAIANVPSITRHPRLLSQCALNDCVYSCSLQTKYRSLKLFSCFFLYLIVWHMAWPQATFFPRATSRGHQRPLSHPRIPKSSRSLIPTPDLIGMGTAVKQRWQSPGLLQNPLPGKQSGCVQRAQLQAGRGLREPRESPKGFLTEPSSHFCPV